MLEQALCLIGSMWVSGSGIRASCTGHDVTCKGWHDGSALGQLYAAAWLLVWEVAFLERLVAKSLLLAAMGAFAACMMWLRRL